jgi:Ca2+-binding RTX toxin-like protein
MTGGRASLFPCLAAGVLIIALALPAASAGHQSATLSGGQLTITGDQQGKFNDLVTIQYDAGANELVIGNDVFGPHPAPCSPDAGHPLRIIHCPAALISRIRIETITGSDEVTASAPAETPIEAALGPDNDSFQGGPEVDTVRGGPGEDKAYGGGGGDKLNGGGSSDRLYGQGGADSLFGGGAADQLFGGSGIDVLNAGPGKDKCNGGPGADHQISCSVGVNY